MKKQFIAKLLVLAMILAMVPATLIAASATDNNVYYYSVSADTATVVSASDIEIVDGELEIVAKVFNGAASVSISEKVMDTIIDKVIEEKAEDLAIVIEAEGATKVDLNVPASALSKFGKKTGADLSVVLGNVASIGIPSESLESFGSVGANAKIGAQNGASIGFSIQVSGRPMKGIEGLTVVFE